MSFVDAALGVVKTGVQIVKRHAPEIAVFAGSAAVLAGGVIACNRTLKAEELLNEHAAKMDMIHKSEQEFDENRYNDTDRKLDKLQVYRETTGKMIRLYAPAISLAAAGFASIFWGFGLLRARYGLALTSIATLEDQFSRYRGNVIKEYGKDVDLRMSDGPEVTFEKAIPSNTGDTENQTDGESETEDSNETETIYISDVDKDTFSRLFDSTSEKWEEHKKGYLFFENTIKQYNQTMRRNLRLGAKTYYSANRIWESFGVSEDMPGNFYGISEDNMWYDTDDHPLVSHWPVIKEFATDDDLDINNYQRLRIVRSLEDWNEFYELFSEDDRRVGYLIKVNVDTDENDVPVNLMNKYGF